MPKVTRVTFKKSTLRRLRDMPKAQARAARRMLGLIAADPAFRHNELKPLRGVGKGYRLRVGDWRISFVLDRRAGVLDVFEIAPRGSAYR